MGDGVSQAMQPRGALDLASAEDLGTPYLVSSRFAATMRAAGRDFDFKKGVTVILTDEIPALRRAAMAAARDLNAAWIDQFISTIVKRLRHGGRLGT